MNHRPELRRNGSFGSDASSFYSSRSGSANSAYSVWSISESDSFVWRDDPYGFYGVGGAVTRYVDDRDDSRRKFAAHILSGPFAQFYKKKRQQTSSRARPGRSSTHSSRSSSRSSMASANADPGRPGHFQPDPRFQQRPASAQPQYYHQEQQFDDEEQFQQEPFLQEPYPQPPFHPGFHGGPPPPPPPPPAPAGAGFEGGFIQLGGPGGPPPPPQGDPVWGHDAGYGPGVRVYD
ncbi:uncharacterized protein F4812DRAFT_28168 [Daldinia caldariorum]|uniref:uncharacterized protein n=1 Tax=Daldinia caldariorum TaxID=326644 RepID=UPI0020083435|nr:uncharacterized protein F4812DRAFT_28168 [Daldinia caldariorum]KAI1472832.1 hypothetical protein F4812DRAFT_28168 [Daldinia caldariorum]